MTVRADRLHAGGSLLIAVLLAAVPARVQPAPVTAVAGFDVASAGADASTRAALLGGIAQLGGFEVTLIGLRFDDRRVGAGSGATVGLGIPLAPATSLQVQGSRFLGDQDYRAWRTRVGPRLGLGGAVAWIAWGHDQIPDESWDGGVLDASVPLIAGLAARLNGAAGRTSQGVVTAAGSGGLAWSALPHLLLFGDVGRSRNGGGVTMTSTPPRLLGLLGGGSTSSEPHPDVLSTTFQLGARVTLP